MTNESRRMPAALPHPRATQLFARTVHRELRRAGYDHHDLVRFVGDLMELVISNMRTVDPEIDRNVTGVIDPETGLPNEATVHEILEFEARRKDRAERTALILICVEVRVPEWFPDDLVQAVHGRTAAALRLRLRPDDTVARLPPNRYLAILPSAAPELLPGIASRFAAALLSRRRRTDESPVPPGTVYVLRSKVVTEDGVGAEALISQCLEAPPTVLELPADLDDGAPPPVSRVERAEVLTAPESERVDEPLRVVLALGGGAVRATAHVGVIDVLRDAGVAIAGIAGTSAGAIVGAMALSGQSNDQIVDRFESFASTPLYKQIRRHYAAYRSRSTRSRQTEQYFRGSGLAFMSDVDLSAVSNDIFAEFVEWFVGPDRDISTLSHPFAACAADIVDGRPSLFMRGPLHQAIRASCAIPGMFEPQPDGERLLVDGSTIAEVPVGAALGLRLHAPVLAVYLERPTPKVERFATSAQVLTRTASLVHTELVREQLRSAPVLLTVPIGAMGWLDFRKASLARQLGRASAREGLEDLLTELHGARSALAK